MGTIDTKKLLKRYAMGKCTEDERQLIELWYMDYNRKEPLLLDEQELESAQSVMLDRLNSRLDKKVKFLFPLKWLSAAAAILIAVTIFFFFPGIRDRGTSHKGSQGHEIAAIAPGSSKAFLILANGNKIDLSTSPDGTIENGKHALITKYKGKLVVTSKEVTDQDDAANVNLLSIPTGGQYEIQLPDGTQVWLNAASSLTFPATFSGLKKRKVKLEGEGYFEVAKNKSVPFIVETSKERITVLGTHFNINSYTGDSVSKTTLLEGAVRLDLRIPGNDSNESGVVLKPGEQSQLTSGHLSVEKVDAEEYVAWKNGYFMFSNEALGDIMTKLSRWYNIEVNYQDESLRQEQFWGSISRSSSLTEVLNVLKRTGRIHFKLKNNTLTVIPNSK